MKIPLVIQPHAGENSIAAIATMLSYYGCHKSLSELRDYNVTSRGGSTPEQVKDMAARWGLDTEIVNADIDELAGMKMPVVVRWNKRYYCIVKSVKRGIVVVADPSRGEYPMSTEAFANKYMGTALIMKPGKGFKKGGRRDTLFDLIKGRLGVVGKSLIWLGVLSLAAVCLNLLMVRATRVMLDVADDKAPTADWFDNIMIHESSDGTLYKFLVSAMVAILLATTAVNIIKTLLIFNTAYSVAAGSGSKLFHKTLFQPMQFFEQYRSGEIIQRLEDNSKLDLSLIRTIVPRIIDFLTTLVYFILMLRYHWKVALLCVSVEVLYFASAMMLKGWIGIMSRGRAVSTSNMNTALLNGINTIETIKTSGAERMFFTGWKTTQQEFDDNRLSNGRINAVENTIDSVHTILSQAVLLFAGAYFMIAGEFTFGVMAALQSVLTSFRSAFSNCIDTINSLQETRTDIERIDDVLQRDEITEIPLTDDYEPDKLPGRLEVSHLAYRYQEGEPLAIEDISFTVEPRQLIAIVGSSGSGKSTLLKCLLSMYEPESGEIRYGGLTRKEIPDVMFRSTITAVDQECVVFEDSIANNLDMWDSTVEDYEMILAARDAHIHDRIMKEPDGYYSAMIENGRNFSGGELQRIELARALSSEPTILLLDEFTSALDAITEAQVFESIREKGTTCVIVAHRLSTVSSCDYILVMEGGRIVQRGTHEELYNQEGLYRRLLYAPGEA
jgi:ABC-type bacteriocin/lantibiotic exporter with double-glycine peptidase domain